MGKVQIKFWGVRGSVATPGPETVRFGGNTACVEILAGKTLIICDAGTGIRQLGLALSDGAKKSITAHILLTHVHWDHYFGLPFFRPLYNSKNRFIIAGPHAGKEGFGAALSKIIRPPYFPIPLTAIPAQISLKTVSSAKFRIGDVFVLPHAVNHPGGAVGWRFFFPNGKSLVHITDNEPGSVSGERKLIKWMCGADILIHDAQYSPKSYSRHKGWGHSPYTYPILLAAKAGIKKVILFHFDPEDDDAYLSRVEGTAKKFAKEIGVVCELAREGAREQL